MWTLSWIWIGLPGLLCLAGIAPAQQPAQVSSYLVESGQVTLDGRSVPYRIHRLPVTSFPELPGAIADALNQRECLIPQTYEAHRPENVVHASLEHAGSSDWVVLCSSHGKVSLLVFFGSALGDPTELAQSAETDRLQRHDDSGTLGFNWAIDPASPQAVHQAQSSMEHHPPLLDHDALADSVIDRRVIYHFYTRNKWTLVDMPE